MLAVEGREVRRLHGQNTWLQSCHCGPGLMTTLCFSFHICKMGIIKHSLIRLT